MSWYAPPSPTFSICDSLDGIDDLDAFLAAQGPLSKFATPDMKHATEVDIMELSSDSDDTASLTDFEMDHGHHADVLSAAAGTGKYSTFFEIVLIQDMLRRAQLPLEVIALSLNILNRYNGNSVLLGDEALNVPSDLLAVASLALAETYTQRPSTDNGLLVQPDL